MESNRNLEKEKRSSTVKALENCHVFVIHRKDFEKLSITNPEICLPIVQVIAQRVYQYLRDSNEKVILLFEALIKEVEDY